MASTKTLNGLPNNLVQQFFSTLFYYDRFYMADWIWHTAIKNNVDIVEIDIINKKVIPASIQIKPIVSQLHRLQETIKSVLISNDFSSDFITTARFHVRLLKDSKTHRFLEVKGIAIDKNGKIYEGRVYSEQSYEDGFNNTFLNSIKSWFTKS